MAFMHPYKVHPQRSWTMEETKIPLQRAWTVEETKIPHRPNSASRSAPRRAFRGSVVVNPTFQRYNDPVETVHEEDMEPQLMEAPPLSHGPHRVAIKRENINVVRECEWDVKSIKEDNFKEKASLGRPVAALIGVICVTSFVSLLLTLLILFGYVGTSNCSCSGATQVGSTSNKMKSSDDRIVKVSENITTLDKKLEGRILEVERDNTEKETKLHEEMANLTKLLEQQKEEIEKGNLFQEKKFKNLTDRLESTQSELKSLKAHLAVQMTGLWNSMNSTTTELSKLKSVWIAVNITAEKTSNLTYKIDQEFKNVRQSVNESNGILSKLMSSLQGLKLKVNSEMETVWLNLNQSRRCCNNLTSSLKSFKTNFTHRSTRLETRIEIEEQKSDNASQLMEQCYKKIVDIENKLNSTREDAEESSRRHLTALWSAGNSTKKEFQKVWTAVNATNIGLLEKLREVKDNLTDQLSSTTVFIKSSDAKLFASLIDVNASITEKVNNVSKMAGPIGPPGFNGSQGPAGPAGSIGPPGPKGAGNFSACQYKEVSDDRTGGTNEASIGVTEASGKRIMGVTCSTNFAQEYNLLATLDQNRRKYVCNCKGPSNLFVDAQGKCFLHYWECPLTT